MRVLRGNDILINWSVFYDAGGVKTNVDFSNSTLSVFILDSYGKREVEHTVSGNVISIHYGGEIQRLGTVAIDAYWQNNNTLVWSRAKKNEVVELVDNPESVTLDGIPTDISITTINTSSDTFFGGTYNANFSNYYTKDEIDNKIITDYNFLSNKPLVYDEETGKYTAVNAPINFVNNINIGNFVAGVSGINFTPNGGGEVGTLTVRDRLIVNGVEITGSGTGGLDVANMWNVLGSADDSDKQINVVHLTDALSGYLQTSIFDDLFEKVNIGTLETPKYAIKAKYDFYSTGEVSAFGAGSGGSSGGGLIQTVYGYSSLGNTFNNATLTDTFNAYTINQLHTRLSQVEVGAAVNVAVSGTGNAVTNVTKNGNVLEFTKGVTFSLDGHTHDYIPLSQKGTANGVASLDANGLIISAQLPSYVDDVIEVSTYANLPASGESGKIYVTTDTNITYRWTGSIYVEISKSIALGETSSTAYRGDLGAIAYAHSQIAGGTGVHISGTERTNWNIAYTNSHTHANKSLLDAFSQSDNDVLDHLSIVDGKLKVDIDLYSLGEVSAFGAGSGTGGSGLIQTVYGLSGLGGTYSDSTLTDTFNAYTINSLHNRINSLEAGSALNFSTTGSGNVVTSVTKSGTSVSVVKGLTAILEGDTRLTNSRPNPYALTFSGYSTATYDGSAAVSVALPTKLSQLTNDSGYLTSIDADLVAIAALTGTSGLLRKTASNTWSLDTNAYLTAITKAQVEDVLTGNITTHTHSQYLTGNQTITVSGDATGSGTTSIALTLANSGVVAGTYNNSVTQISPFAVDAKGRITGIGSAVTIQPAWGSVTGKPTTIGGYGITDAYTKTQTDAFLALKLDAATFNDLFEKVNIGTTASPVYAIKAKYNFYSVGEVSAFGAGAGSGSSGLIQTVYGYSGLGGTYNNATLTDTFNAYTINKINTDLGARITSLEAGSALTFTTVGSGNAVTSVTKSGTSVTVTKGLTFSVDGHTHSYLPLSGGQLTGQLSLLQGAGGGIIFPNDSFGGSGDSASIKLLNPAGGESTEMTFTITNDADDIINFNVPSIDGVKINRYTVWNAANFTNLTQLTTRNFSDLQNKPTTLSGYGITDSIARDDRGGRNIIANSISYSVYGFGYLEDGFPTNGSFISFGGLNNRYVTQIQGNYGGAGMYYRTRNDDNGTWNSWHTILDDVNAYTKTSADNTFLKLAGGAMTGQLQLRNTSLYLDHENVRSWTISAYNTGGALAINSGDGAGGLYFNGNTIWHSGNDGANSGLDADTLDGVHYQNILERNQSGYSESGTATGWFRIATFTSDNAGSQDCILIINRTFNYASNETYKFSISAAYDGGINITQLSGYALTRLIDKIRVDYVNSGIAYIELHISTSTTNNAYRWTTVGAAKSYTAWTAVSDTPNGTSYEFTTVNGCKSDRGFTGDLAGNSSTATKLQTARSIWGQNFDGSGNVDGRIAVNYGASNGVAAIHANLSSSTNVYAWGLNVTNSNQNTGVYTVGYLFGVNNNRNYQATGLFYYAGANSASNRYGLGFYENDNILNIRADGNVGIGTLSPNYTLDVNGTLNTNGTLSIRPTNGNYNEGIRIHKSPSNWAALMFCGLDNTGDAGTSFNSWGIFNSDTNNFHINRGAGSANTGYELCNVNGNWGVGTNTPAYKLDVNGTLNVNGTATFKDIQVAYDKRIGIEYSTTDRTMYNYFYGNNLFHLSVGNWTSSTSTKVFSIDTPLANALSIWNNGAAEFSNVVTVYNTINANKNTPSGTAYHQLGIQVFSNDGSPVGIGFHRAGYSQTILEHSGDGLTIRNSGTIGTGSLGNLYVGTVNSGTILTASLTARDWLRVVGMVGISFEDYGGGIYMTDNKYIKFYGAKALSISNTDADSINTNGGILAGGSINSSNRIFTGYDSGQANSISCSNWFISSGASGWYNGTYGGGITMIDSTYVRVYNGKAFWVDNNIVATGEITAFGASDIRLKSNIKQINSALDFLGKVKTYEFDWNEKAIELNPLKTKKGAGVIAQEMNLLDNNFVHSIYGDYLGVDYERFIPYLIGGVNEVADEVTILKKKVAELELEIKQLKK